MKIERLVGGVLAFGLLMTSCSSTASSVEQSSSAPSTSEPDILAQRRLPPAVVSVMQSVVAVEGYESGTGVVIDGVVYTAGHLSNQRNACDLDVEVSTPEGGASIPVAKAEGINEGPPYTGKDLGRLTLAKHAQVVPSAQVATEPLQPGQRLVIANYESGLNGALPNHPLAEDPEYRKPQVYGAIVLKTDGNKVFFTSTGYNLNGTTEITTQNGASGGPGFTSDGKVGLIVTGGQTSSLSKQQAEQLIGPLPPNAPDQLTYGITVGTSLITTLPPLITQC